MVLGDIEGKPQNSHYPQSTVAPTHYQHSSDCLWPQLACDRFQLLRRFNLAIALVEKLELPVKHLNLGQGELGLSR